MATLHRTKALGVLTRVYTCVANWIAVMQLVTPLTNLLTPPQAACVFKGVRQSDKLWVFFSRMTTFPSIVRSDVWSYRWSVYIVPLSRSNCYCKHLYRTFILLQDIVTPLSRVGRTARARYCESTSHTAGLDIVSPLVIQPGLDIVSPLVIEPRLDKIWNCYEVYISLFWYLLLI